MGRRGIPADGLLGVRLYDLVTQNSPPRCRLRLRLRARPPRIALVADCRIALSLLAIVRSRSAIDSRDAELADLEAAYAIAGP